LDGGKYSVIAWLQQSLQAKACEDDCVRRLMTTARNPVGVAPIGFTVSDPPTQAEVQEVVDTLNRLIGALPR
jgi:hypothetical protein